VSGRWTEARHRVLVESRVQLTKQLVGAIAEARPRPKTLISGSAVGYYGDPKRNARAMGASLR